MRRSPLRPGSAWAHAARGCLVVARTWSSTSSTRWQDRHELRGEQVRGRERGVLSPAARPHGHDARHVAKIEPGARALKLSARCSVFMKSDCTHKLNKGEATREDIALSLSKVMADKVGSFSRRPVSPTVSGAGGRHDHNGFSPTSFSELAELDIVIPSRRPILKPSARPSSRVAGAGAAASGRSRSRRGDAPLRRFQQLSCAKEWVEYLPSVRGEFDRGPSTCSASMAARPPPRSRSSTPRHSSCGRPLRPHHGIPSPRSSAACAK